MARGRPRQFDEAEALTGAIQVFWQKGFSATSLDDLSVAMNMKRPSIYNAFGNKDDLYRRALAQFCGQLDLGLKETLEQTPDLQAGLEAFFFRAIDVYCAGEKPMGCLMMCTAPSEALSHPRVGEDLKALIQRLDEGITDRLKRAQQAGELTADADPVMVAKLLQATLHSIALRARSGAPKRELRSIARYAVAKLAA